MEKRKFEIPFKLGYNYLGKPFSSGYWTKWDENTHRSVIDKPNKNFVCLDYFQTIDGKIHLRLLELEFFREIQWIYFMNHSGIGENRHIKLFKTIE